MSGEQKIYELEASEKQFLSDSLHMAKQWLSEPEELLDPEALNTLFLECLKDLETGQMERAQIVNVLGTAYGNLLTEKLSFRWIIVEDSYGTDYAVRHDATGVMAFPHSSVAKRVESKEPDFIPALFAYFKEQVGK